MQTEKNLNDKFIKLNQFIKLNNSFYFLINKGTLAEFYCTILFNLKRASYKLNAPSPDLINRRGKKIRYEVKNRKIDKYNLRKIINGSKTPTGMKIDLSKIDYVLYVFLDNKNMMPLCIFKIPKDEITYLNKKTKKVTFISAFKNNIRKKIVYKASIV